MHGSLLLGRHFKVLNYRFGTFLYPHLIFLIQDVYNARITEIFIVLFIIINYLMQNVLVIDAKKGLVSFPLTIRPEK